MRMEVGKLVSLLKQKKMLITTVESLTGGAIASCIVSVPGASDVLHEAYITYCDEAKHKLAGVKKETLEKYTAVSRQTAYEMAAGGLKRAEADICISATGLAGPDGGTEEIPVGTVFIGCALRDRCEVMELHLNGSRSLIRKNTVEKAVEFAAECIEKQKGSTNG